MADHEELVAELAAVEKMPTAERLKHARKKRIQQLKKYSQYEKQLEKEQLKKSNASSGSSSYNKKHQAGSASHCPRPSSRGNVRFVSNVILLEAATRNDVDEGKLSISERAKYILLLVLVRVANRRLSSGCSLLFRLSIPTFNISVLVLRRLQKLQQKLLLCVLDPSHVSVDIIFYLFHREDR